MIRRMTMAVVLAGSLALGLGGSAALAGAQAEEEVWDQCWTFEGDLCPTCCTWCTEACLGKDYLCCPGDMNDENQ